MPVTLRTRFLILSIDALLIALGVFGALRVAVRAGLPIQMTTRDGTLSIERVEEEGVRSGLEAGDRIISLAGQRATTPQEIEFLTDHFRIGDELHLEVEQAGVIRMVQVPLVKDYGARYLVIQILAGGLYFFLGILALIQRPDDKAAHCFHWLSVSVGVMIMSTWASYVIPPWGVGYMVQILDLLANAAIPVFFVAFSFEFPRKKADGGGRVIIPLFLVSMGFLFWMVLSFVQSLNPPIIAEHTRFLVAFKSFRWFFSACLIFGVINLLHSYFAAGEEVERRKLRWVILGLGLGPLGFILLWVIPYIVLNRALIAPEIVLLISAIAPITFTISIVRYQVMDIDLIFNRGTVYFIVLGALLAIYAMVVGTIAFTVGTFTVRASVIASGVAATIVALLFEPTRRFSQNLVDRTFFRVRYNYREALGRFGEEVSRCVDEVGLADILVSRADELLRPERIGFYQIERSGSEAVLLAHKDGKRLTAPGIAAEIAERVRGRTTPLALDEKLESGRPHESMDEELSQRAGIVLAFGMQSEKGDPRGVLVLGAKKSGARFNLEDIDLLNSVVTQAELAINRIRVQKKLVLERAETQRLEELSEAKSYFVSSVSHELKTPLTSIRMFAEMLRTHKDIAPEKSQEYLEIIEGESERLSAVIGNVLDFAKVERGIKEYDFADIDLNELVSQVMKSMQYQFKMHEFEVQVDQAAGGVRIHADGEAVIECVTNLLSNAMKYSYERKEIRVATFIRDEFGGVEVEDQGIGISEEEQEHIFDPFYRSKEDTTPSTAGVGLGLALVKHTMDAHGGKVWVRSEPGRGSTFSLLFPLEEDNETHPDR
ncbi:ATP-binding protein [Candidatus Neomarinimicrobiota bacterium]